MEELDSIVNWNILEAYDKGQMIQVICNLSGKFWATVNQKVDFYTKKLSSPI